GEPARSASRLRQPPPAQRRGSAGRADAARPRRHIDDADLYPRAGGAPQEPGARSASTGGGVKTVRPMAPGTDRKANRRSDRRLEFHMSPSSASSLIRPMESQLIPQ